jgi:hypothetical protein
MRLMSNRPSSLWEPTLPLYSREDQVQVSLGLRSMVYVRQVQEGAVAAWMDLSFIV